jgi:large subunit ribosomal protein L35Ae
MVNARIIQFRRGRRTVHERHMLIEIEGIDSKEKAMGYVGKKVGWTSPGKKIISGIIAAPHGRKGVVRAIFEMGLPGQSISTPVKILGDKD